VATPNAQGERTRARTLDAAMHVIEERGATALSLNAVAERAGVSKGTLLYHFPTKEALVQAVVDHYVQRFEEAVDEHARRHPGPDAWLRAYVAVGLDDGERRRSRALFGTLAVNPDVTDRLRDRQRGWQRRVEEGDADPDTALLVKLAVDGVLIADFTGAAPAAAPLLRTIERVLDGG
jgi:AcrR family transcriptional regulator